VENRFLSLISYSRTHVCRSDLCHYIQLLGAVVCITHFLHLEPSWKLLLLVCMFPLHLFALLFIQLTLIEKRVWNHNMLFPYTSDFEYGGWNLLSLPAVFLFLFWIRLRFFPSSLFLLKMNLERWELILSYILSCQSFGITFCGKARESQ
jgi:hypothetical protein